MLISKKHVEIEFKLRSVYTDGGESNILSSSDVIPNFHTVQKRSEIFTFYDKIAQISHFTRTEVLTSKSYMHSIFNEIQNKVILSTLHRKYISDRDNGWIHVKILSFVYKI